MKKSSFLVLAVGVTFILCGVAGAQAPGARQAIAGNAENGKRLYNRDGCYECHGYAGQGGRDGPRIAATNLPVQVLIRYVRSPFGAMPAFTEKVLSDKELTDIYAYLKALAIAKPTKDIPLLYQLRDK
jgi:mono/diheme cytochrome c family protein